MAGSNFWRWCFEHLPGFAPISKLAYGFIAGHRELAGALTSLLWGKDVRRPTYFQARRWFLRLLGAVYLIAFLSFWVQADALIGANGIMPLPQLLTAARDQLGPKCYFVLPTLCWLSSTNAFLHFLCGAGAVLSVLLIVEIAPVLCLALLFVLYLSLTIAGQTFYSFQWDILLLETGFLAIFLAPWRWWPRRGQPAPLSRPALFLLHFLLFKLMLLSGVVKLTSGDASWWNLTALDYHYWTQPLPTVLGWWIDKAPEWFKQFSTAFAIVVEIAGAFLIWCPRRLRLLGCGAMVFLQILIGLTGNYAFFNLLTIALCLLLIDDAVWPGARRLTKSEPAGRRWPVWIPAARYRPDHAGECDPDFRRFQTGDALAASAGVDVCRGRPVPDCQQLRPFSRHDERAAGDHHRGERRRRSNGRRMNSNGNRARSIGCRVSWSRINRGLIGRCGSLLLAMRAKIRGFLGSSIACSKIRPRLSTC